MKFWGAILEHFGLLFGTKNGQKRHQNMIGKMIQKNMKKRSSNVMRVHASIPPCGPLKVAEQQTGRPSRD